MQTEKQKYRLFGRSKGRSNKSIDIAKYTKQINKYIFKNFDQTQKYILDIGTGYGETTIYLSEKYKNNKIIACEKYVNGNLNLIINIEKKQLQNIYIHDGNVHEILDKNKKGKYFDLVFIFFPDPWPKKKHHKRRLINSNFLKKIYEYIHDNGFLYIATDSTSYSREIIKNFYMVRKLFNWENSNQLHLSIDHYFNIKTKFYKKAIFCGRKPSLFILKKI